MKVLTLNTKLTKSFKKLPKLGNLIPNPNMFTNRKSNYYESLENHVFGPPEHGNVKLLAQTQTS